MSKSTVWPESALDKLGKVKDMDIATEFGMSRATVRNKRIELGISAYDELKWTAKMDEKLGTKTDVKLAEEFGISVKSVRRRRAGLNIPAHEKTIWTAERESLLGTKPDTEIAKITGLTIEQVIYRRRMLRIPKFNDKRAKNGGHSTAGKAGRPTITDRKVSKTVAMRQLAWDWLDDPKNGAARGGIIEQLISDKIQQPPAGQGGNLKEVNKMEIKSIERNDDLQGFIVTLSNNKIVQIQYELNTNRLDADHNTHYPVIDKQNDYGHNLTADEEEKFEAWMHAQWIKTGTQIREYAEELDSKYEEEQKYRETLSSEELAQHKFYYDDLGNFIG